MTEAIRYSDTLTLRTAPIVMRRIEQAALARGCKPSEWVRQAVLTGLQLDGLDPASTSKSTAAGAFDGAAFDPNTFDV